MNIDKTMPKHVAIIMDGNRRWAKTRGKPANFGHKAGAKNLRKLSEHILDLGIKYLSVFAFSTENFKRSQEEVDLLMDLFVQEFKNNYDDIAKKNIRIFISGRREGLRQDVIDTIDEINAKTKNNNGGFFNICLNYGGHSEIIDATKKIAEDVLNKKINIEDINEDLFSSYLYTNMPPIDFLIRTSGEMRVSNFMLWQLSYAEMYFPEIHFPDFNEEEFNRAIEEFQNRKRRFGGE